MSKYKCVLAALLFIGSTVVSADEDLGYRPWELFPLPVFFYDSETGLAGGVALTALYHPDWGDQVSSVGGIGYYTQNNQTYVAVQTDWYLGQGARRLSASVSGALFPYRFYGVGPDTPDDAEETYTPRSIETEVSYLWLLRPGLSLGPHYRLLATDMDEIEKGGLLDTGGVTGSDGATISGGGVRVVWDDRDSQFGPTRGIYATATLSGHPLWLGSSDAFYGVRLDARHYRELFPQIVIAFQGLLELNGGDVPFQVLPQLGGSAILRGYAQPRYIDNDLLAAQTELRFPIFWRVGGVVFGGAAKVAPTVGRLFAPEYLRFASGAGLRFQLTRDRPINFRFDAAYASQGLQLYFGVTEAF